VSQRRYGALTTYQRLQVLLVFALVQIAVWILFRSPGIRFSLGVLTAAVLAVLVKTRRRPRR
jgi:hypothetical protein